MHEHNVSEYVISICNIYEYGIYHILTKYFETNSTQYGPHKNHSKIMTRQSQGHDLHLQARCQIKIWIEFPRANKVTLFIILIPCKT